MVEHAPTMARPLNWSDLASGEEGCERLLSADDLPEELALETRRRLAVLAPELATRAPSTRIHPVWMTLPGGWSAVNASIAAADDGYRMLVQSSNWTVDANGQRVIHDARGIARSVNNLIDMRANFSVRGFHAVHELPVDESDLQVPQVGMEYCRLFPHRGEWWISATAHHGELDPVRRTAIGRVDGLWLADKHLFGDQVDGAAGDWMPASGTHGGRLRFVVSIAPTVVLAYEHLTGAVDVEVRLAAPAIARHLQGSSQAIPWNGGRLGLARDMVPMPGGRPIALHRWVWFEPGWRLERISAPFVFIERGAEIATGLAARDGRVIITFGVGDREAKLAVVSSSEVESMLALPLALDPEAAAQPSLLDANGARRSLAGGRAADTTAATAPKIVSVTISGNSRDIIAAALRSVVDWVDWVVLVDTGITDDTIEVARTVAGEKLIVREFPWRNDFSAARNFSLAAAAETDAEWAVIVDTDERIVINGVDVLRYLAETTEPALLAPHSSGEYTKDRFFRLPAWGEFRGPTHEAFYRVDVDGGARVAVPGVAFEELAKSEETLLRKRQRDRDILQQEVGRDPSSARSFFYLGDALQGLGRAWKRPWLRFRPAQICAAGTKKAPGRCTGPPTVWSIWAATTMHWTRARPA